VNTARERFFNRTRKKKNIYRNQAIAWKEREKKSLPVGNRSPSIVGGWVEHLELDRDIVSRLATRRIEHMAGNGTTTSSHDELVNEEENGKG
jgi:hypothetical protein